MERRARWCAMAGRVVLYDGACGLCCRSAEFIAKRDPRGRFQLAALDSSVARSLLAEHGLPPNETETVVLLHEGRAYTRSTAALRIARGLRAPWPVAVALLAVPRPLRDWAYEVVARHRRQWFGGADSCPAPSDALRARRLDKQG